MSIRFNPSPSLALNSSSSVGASAPPVAQAAPQRTGSFLDLKKDRWLLSGAFNREVLNLLRFQMCDAAKITDDILPLHQVEKDFERTLEQLYALQGSMPLEPKEGQKERILALQKSLLGEQNGPDVLHRAQNHASILHQRQQALYAEQMKKAREIKEVP